MCILFVFTQVTVNSDAATVISPQYIVGRGAAHPIIRERRDAVTPTGDFQRSASGGVFQIVNYPTSGLGITLKIESCYKNFVVSGGRAGCRHGNPRCHQWRQIWHHDDPRFSVYRNKFRIYAINVAVCLNEIGFVYANCPLSKRCIVWKRISVMVCKISAYPNCSGRVITAPEDL